VVEVERVKTNPFRVLCTLPGCGSLCQHMLAAALAVAASQRGVNSRGLAMFPFAFMVITVG
jgi:hypothetical protein